MKTKILLIAILVSIAVTNNAQVLKKTTSNVVAIEKWYAIMDNDPNNYFSHLLEKDSEGAITTVTESWQYVYIHATLGAITIVDSTPRIGPVTINGTDITFSVEGTATITSPAFIAGQTSSYTFSTTGIANNGTAMGTYTINFITTGWPGTVQGTFSSTRINGSGITAELQNGVENTTMDKQVILYPNPTSDAFVVNGIEGTATLSVSNLEGGLLFTKEVTVGEKISVSSLSNGVYLVTVKSKGSTKTEKLVIE